MHERQVIFLLMCICIYKCIMIEKIVIQTDHSVFHDETIGMLVLYINKRWIEVP